MPDLTFVATLNPVRYVGATPVLADVEPERYGLDPAVLPQLLTPRTRAMPTRSRATCSNRAQRARVRLGAPDLRRPPRPLGGVPRAHVSQPHALLAHALLAHAGLAHARRSHARGPVSPTPHRAG